MKTLIAVSAIASMIFGTMSQYIAPDVFAARMATLSTLVHTLVK